MKRIVGFQNKGGMRLKKELEIYDEEIIRIAGKKGMRKLINELRKIQTKRKLGTLIYCPIEETFAEIEEIIDNAILEQEHAI